MTEIIYKSSLREHISRFISLKQLLGHPYDANARILKDFDAVVFERFPGADTVSKAISDVWIEVRASHPKSLEHNVSAVRQFTKYLNGIGIPAYITPKGYINNRVKYEPHIYTLMERIAFFNAIDQCPFRRVSPTKHFIVPIVFRLLFCCGLRASEVMMLKRTDVDLISGKIFIRESKGWTARIIYISDDLLENLTEYDKIIEAMLPGRIPFFPNRKGSFYSSNILDKWFHEFWDDLPVAQLVTGNSPRVHDWRHTMITERLNRWVVEDRNVNALYVYLSEYVGHSSYASTDYYLHLVASFYPEMKKRLSPMDRDILPEVYIDEK
jgi:integrase